MSWKPWLDLVFLAALTSAVCGIVYLARVFDRE